MEKMFRLYSEFDPSPERLKQFKVLHLRDGGAHKLIGIKFYTSTRNTLAIARAILTIDPSYIVYPPFWINLTAALLLPKPAIAFVRDLLVHTSQKKLHTVLRKINFDHYVGGTIPAQT